MPAVKTNNILDTDNASKTDIKTIDNKIKTKVLTEENPQKLKSIHNTFENKEEIKEVRENKYIIILLIFLSMLIMYFSLYTIKKYKEKLIEEMNIYFELRKRMREYEK